MSRRGPRCESDHRRPVVRGEVASAGRYRHGYAIPAGPSGQRDIASLVTREIARPFDNALGTEELSNPKPDRWFPVFHYSGLGTVLVQEPDPLAVRIERGT